MQDSTMIELIRQLELSQWASLGIIILMTLESIPFTGLLLPGIFIMVALGSISNTSYLSFQDCVLYASSGALLGDSVGYWLAYLGVTKRFNQPSQLLRQSKFRKILGLIHRYGAFAVFGGRFLWFVHPLVPVVSGLSRIKPYFFYLADIPAVICWTLLYAGLGHWATGLARQRTFEFFTTLSILVFLVAFIALLRYLRR